MSPRRRARIQSADEVAVVVSDADDEPPPTRRRTKPVQRLRGGPPGCGGTCCFPGCNLPVGIATGSNSAYPTFTDENAKCCDRCHKIVVADRLEHTHAGFPQRECIHPTNREHVCLFTGTTSNVDKWKRWAAFSFDDYGICCLSLELSGLIGESMCVLCATSFLERCNILKHRQKHGDDVYEFAVSCMLTSMWRASKPDGRASLARIFFREWWNSPTIKLSEFAQFEQSSLVLKYIVPALRGDQAHPYHARLDQAYRRVLGHSPETHALDGRASGVDSDKAMLDLARILSEVNVFWWSAEFFSGFYKSEHLAACFEIMIHDMNRALEPLSGEDAVSTGEMYFRVIADIFAHWLCRKEEGDDALWDCLNDDKMTLGDHAVLNGIVELIDLPKLIVDRCVEFAESQERRSEGAPYNKHNVHLFTERYCEIKGHRFYLEAGGCVEQQIRLILCFYRNLENAAAGIGDVYIIDALQLLMRKFPPFFFNPHGFAMAVHCCIGYHDGRLVKLFFDESLDDGPARARMCDFLTNGEHMEETVREAFGIKTGVDLAAFRPMLEMSVTLGGSFRRRCFQTMLHLHACDIGRYFTRGFFPRPVENIVFPAPDAFPEDIRQHECFWIPEDPKKMSLQMAQSTIDKYKEQLPDGVYLTIMDELAREWRQD